MFNLKTISAISLVAILTTPFVNAEVPTSEPPTICTDLSEAVIGGVYVLKLHPDYPEMVRFRVTSVMKVSETYQMGLAVYDSESKLVERVVFGLPHSSKQSFDFYFDAGVEGFVESGKKGISQICIYEAGDEG